MKGLGEYKKYVMGINSYISHRMFVAALNHDEITSAKDGQQCRAEEVVRYLASKIPLDLRFNALADARTAMRSRPVVSPTDGP